MITAEECRTYKEFVDKYQAYIYPLLGARIAREYGREGGKVIDMGTGPGLLSAELAQRIGGFVHAVDINPAMHELATAHVENLSLSHLISMDNVDVHKQPYADQYADLIVSYSCLHHWEDPVQGLKECYRVLAPGGLIFLIDTLPNDENTLDSLNRLVPEPEYFRFIREAFEESYSLEQVEDMLKQAGIDNYNLGLFGFVEEDIVECIDILQEMDFPEVDSDSNAKSWLLVVRKPQN